MYPFKNQKIKYRLTPKQEGSANKYVTRPSKNYKPIMWYDRMNGNESKVSGVAPIRLRCMGTSIGKM